MEEMDALEQMAQDLEVAQRDRHKKAKAHKSLENEANFWTEAEHTIFQTIRTFREVSRTYQASGSQGKHGS